MYQMGNFQKQVVVWVLVLEWDWGQMRCRRD